MALQRAKNLVHVRQHYGCERMPVCFHIALLSLGSILLKPRLLLLLLQLLLLLLSPCFRPLAHFSFISRLATGSNPNAFANYFRSFMTILSSFLVIFSSFLTCLSRVFSIFVAFLVFYLVLDACFVCFDFSPLPSASDSQI